MLCFEMSSGGVLHDSVNEDFSLKEGNDVLMTVEPSPALLGRLSQFEHHGQARASCTAPFRAAMDGAVTMNGQSGFRFRLKNNDPNDVGLEFTK